MGAIAVPDDFGYFVENAPGPFYCCGGALGSAFCFQRFRLSQLLSYFRDSLTVVVVPSADAL